MVTPVPLTLSIGSLGHHLITNFSKLVEWVDEAGCCPPRMATSSARTSLPTGDHSHPDERCRPPHGMIVLFVAVIVGHKTYVVYSIDKLHDFVNVFAL